MPCAEGAGPLHLKGSGKWVIANAPAYTEGSYYLASVADKVYMNPSGQLELNGLAMDVMFYKGLFIPAINKFRQKIYYHHTK